ncbi:MAG: pilus assembly protein [Geminicoccaceae bacterium]|nr:pilus assembly protein [Geminicoccaceae bacterium]
MPGRVPRQWPRRWIDRFGERGASAVEFALVAPILIALLLGIAQVGLVVMYRTAATDAARDVARAVSLGRLDLATARTRLRTEVDRLLPAASEAGQTSLQPTYASYEEGDAVVVDLEIPLRNLLWSPALGEALGSIRTTVRTLKPGG